MNQAHRILIVEDEPNVRIVFRTALESGDYRVTTAADGETALAWLGQEHFDVVLLDLQMPAVGGTEVLARLRERGDRIPVVIVSAHDRPRDVIRAVRLGAIDFLAKPVTPAALRRMVADVIAREEAGDLECHSRMSHFRPIHSSLE